MQKKIMIFSWRTVNDYTPIYNALVQMGFRCIVVDIGMSDQRDKAHYDFFVDYLKDKNIDAVISVNFFDYLSKACNKYDIPYIAWLYDSPIRFDEFDTLLYDNTHIFTFDSYEASRMQNRYNMKRAHYLPLAADTDSFDRLHPSKSDRERYQAQISFVGSLYESSIENYADNLSDYYKGYFNGVIDSATGRYDSQVIETFRSEHLLEWIDNREFLRDVLKKESDINIDDYNSEEGEEKLRDELSLKLSKMLSHAVTNKERVLIISMLSSHFKFKLYSGSKSSIIKNAIECGRVNYNKEMPLVFKCSDINLNITYKAIKAGMPLRCLDIMGCGGFLLTNYQKDFDDDFIDGVNIAIFRSIEEAYEKCEYYLKNDDVRKRIARAGYETVKKKYNYPLLLSRAFELSGLKESLELM